MVSIETGIAKTPNRLHTAFKIGKDLLPIITGGVGGFFLFPDLGSTGTGIINVLAGMYCGLSIAFFVDFFTRTT